MMDQCNKHKDEAHVRMQILVDAMPLACHLWNRNHELFESNAENLRLFKIDDKQIFYDRFYDFSPTYQPDGQRSDEIAPIYLEKAFTEGKCVIQWIHQLLDGTPIPTEVTIVRIDYENDYILASYVRDLRRHYQMVSQIDQYDNLLHAVNDTALILLAYEEENFESTLQKGLEHIAVRINIDRVYIWKNEVIDGVLHYVNLYEWLKSDSHDGPIVHPQDKYPYHPRWENKFLLGECINSPISSLPPYEQEMLHPYGIKSILIIPIHMHGDLWGFVSFDDCQGERTFTSDEEQILRSASLLLVNTITKYLMTLEIQNTAEKLKKAFTATQEASNAKSSFLATMSHEIRTPLNAIIGMARIGKSASSTERMLYAFDRIGDASDHLLGVINDILDMSKIEAGKLELSYGEFNFEKMIQTTVNVIGHRIKEKRQKFTVTIDKAIPCNLIGDDQRLAQTITNLLSNAVKFTAEEKSIRLDSCLIDEQDGICTLHISVTDTGIGISAEQQARLFTSFQQADRSISRRFGGTGLGLTISKQIVELMGGRIWIESELGAGTAFMFAVQIKRGSEQTSSLLHPDLDTNNINMLFVDDDQEAQTCFMNIAERLGIQCDTAASGAEALRHIDNTPYTICFLNWDMPDMDVVELSRQIMTHRAENPIMVIISAYELNDIERDLTAEGITSYLTKPLFTLNVADCINKCLSHYDNTTVKTSSNKILSLKGCNILLVEDIELNREIILSMLEPTMATIDCAKNGVEAVHLFKKYHDKYDLIFMDLQMPEMDGYEATRIIRALEIKKAKDIPIIAMTADVFREDIKNCLEAGMTRHLGKPVDVNEIFGVLQYYL